MNRPNRCLASESAVYNAPQDWSFRYMYCNGANQSSSSYPVTKDFFCFFNVFFVLVNIVANIYGYTQHSEGIFHPTLPDNVTFG